MCAARAVQTGVRATFVRLRLVQAAVVDEVQNATAFEATALVAQLPAVMSS